MKIFPRFLLLLLALPAGALAADPTPTLGPLPAVLPADAAAVVNGQPIPRSLVATFLRNDREALEINPATEDGRAQVARLREGVLDELINRALIAQEVQAKGLEPTEAQIDADERPMREFAGTEARYQEFLRQNGFSRQEYRDIVLRAAARGRILSETLTRDLTISDAEVAADYEVHRGAPEFQWPERVTGAHILLGARPGVLGAELARTKGLAPGSPELVAAVAEETARRGHLAETIRAEAAAPGADFAALAARHSEDLGTRGEGGSLGTFAKGVHPLNLDDAFFALAVGEVGPVVRTDFGFHVIKALDHRPAGPRTLAETAPLIRPRLLAVRQAERLREWLRTTRERAVIVLDRAAAN